MTQRNPGWRLWAMLVETTRREVAKPSWTTVVPQIVSTRPDGAPLLAGATLALTPRLARRWVEQILRPLASAPHQYGRRPALRRLQDAEAMALLEAGVCSDGDRLETEAAGLGMEAQAMASVIHLAILPLLQACARVLEQRVSPTWPCSYCPVCGAWPTSAERRGIERTYRLRCARCGGDWGTVLLCCPYCGEHDHQRLGTLIPARGGETRQVHVCRTCNGYIKVLTTLQRTPGERLISDDLKSVDLDVAALERGYSRPTRPGYVLTTYLIPRCSRWRSWFGRRESGQRFEGYDNVTPC